MKLSVGDSVRFTLGDTPMLGIIQFAVGSGAAAVKLTSGTEIIIDLDTVEFVKSKWPTDPRLTARVEGNL